MQPLILLHGALGTRDQFSLLKTALNSKRSVHDLNFSGHGGSADNTDFTMRQFAWDVISYMDAHNLTKADVFGFSMGGYVALKLAENNPDRIGKITTLGTKLNWTVEFATGETQKLRPEKIEEKVPVFAAGLKQLHGDRWKTVVTKTAHMMERLPDDPVSPEKIKNEVHILLGDKDNMVSVEESTQMANLLTNGRFTLLENVVHPVEKVDIGRLLPFLV